VKEKVDNIREKEIKSKGNSWKGIIKFNLEGVMVHAYNPILQYHSGSTHKWITVQSSLGIK
jgi:hypothetical protein